MNCLRLNEKEPLKAAEALKTRLIELGLAPLPAHKELLNTIKNYDNPWLKPRAKRKDWTKGLKVKDVAKEKCEYLFFAGCTPAFDPLIQHEIVNTIKGLQKAKIDVGILGEKEICCGSPAIRIGHREIFFDLVKRNIETFNEFGIKKIITHCAGCFHTLKYDFPEVPGMPDGLLDMWLFSGTNLGDVLRHAYEMWRGLHVTSDAARCITFRNLRIEAESPYWIQTDGEPRGSTQITEINVRSRVLRMLMPPRGMSLLKNVPSKGVNEHSSIS